MNKKSKIILGTSMATFFVAVVSTVSISGAINFKNIKPLEAINNLHIQNWGLATHTSDDYANYKYYSLFSISGKTEIENMDFISHDDTYMWSYYDDEGTFTYGKSTDDFIVKVVATYGSCCGFAFEFHVSNRAATYEGDSFVTYDYIDYKGDVVSGGNEELIPIEGEDYTTLLCYHDADGKEYGLIVRSISIKYQC